MKLTLYHGSKYIIDTPYYGGGKQNNDYGKGFYCTEYHDLAGEWAVNNLADGYINHYEIEIDGLDIIKLDENYNILNWLAILLENRTFEIQSDFGKEAIDYIRNNFMPRYNSADIIIGYRADDSYFSFAQDFLNNIISLKTLSRAMQLGNLGTQIVIKSQEAFERLEFIDYQIAERREWYKLKETRDIKARNDYRKIRQEPWKKGELYIMNIIEQEIKDDDARIRL